MLKQISNVNTGYYIDEQGNVYKFSHKMSSYNNGIGYYQIKLLSNKTRKTFYVHRLVWETFKGKIPKGYEINHKDHNKANNDLSNLELVTHSENVKKAVKFHGKFGFLK